ncbi:MAG TPA: ABC transporter substrate-binding protein [Bauldia sp.]|nr:ABC transporter substrate-binding protein [Bauldia sp.]
MRTSARNIRLTSAGAKLALVAAGIMLASSAFAADPIKIGVVESKTGFMQGYDGPPSQGVELAVKDINAAGGVLGRPLEIISYDQKTDPALAATGATQLIDQGAVAIVAACDFDFGSPAAVVANAKQIPAISTCAGDPKFGVQGIGPYAYMMALGSNYQAGALAEWTYNKKSWKTAYVITDETVEYTKGLARYFKEAFTGIGGSVVGEASISMKDLSIAAQITSLKALNPQPDMIFIASFVPDLTAAVKQLRAAGVNTPIVGGSGYDGEDWAKAIPGLSDVYFGAEGYTFGPDVPSEWALVEKYKAAYGSDPTSNTFLTGYAVIQAFAAAITQAGSTDGPAINDKLSNLKDLPTALGNLSYTPDYHSPVRPMALNAFKDGKEIFLEFVTPTKWPDAFPK